MLTPLTLDEISQASFPKDTMNSVLLIRDANGGQSCSANLVSDEGHIITAFHCLQACMQSQGWFASEPLALRDDLRLRYRTTTETPPIECPLIISFTDPDGVKNISSIARIIAGPQCLAEKKKNDRWNMSKNFDVDMVGTHLPLDSEVYHDCDRSQDLVIVQVDPSRLHKKNCVSLHKEPSYLNTPVINIGFPTSTIRGAGDSRGDRLYFSMGEIIQSASCTIKYLSGATLRTQLPFSYGKMLLQSNVDIVPRSSGSALLNKKGQVVGVASAISVPLQSETSFCRGATMFANVLHLKHLDLTCEKQKIKE